MDRFRCRGETAHMDTLTVAVKGMDLILALFVFDVVKTLGLSFVADYLIDHDIQ